MQVLLINPSSDFLTFKTHEVLSLGYLAAALDKDGHRVEIYDCNFQDPETAFIADRIRKGSYDMIGVTTMIGKTAHAIEIAAAARKVSPAFIILGGYSATYEYEEIMKECSAVDAILRGEGEEVLRELVRRLERGESWHDMKSMVYRDGEQIVANPMLTLHMNLDDFPFPWRSPYLQQIGLASILSARGCYAKCSFCNIQEFYNLSGYGGIRIRSAANVVDEIEQIRRQHGIRKFLFIDDDMLGADFFARGRNAQIAEEIIRRDLKIEFEVAGRSNDVIKFEDTVKRLKDAGLKRVYIGIESGAETQLKRQHKSVHKKQNFQAMDVLKRNNLGLDMGFIPFDPWSTPEEIVENMHFLNESGVMEAANLNTAAVTMILYPGTALYDRARKEDLFIRAQHYTYAYRFKHTEHAELFTRIIYTIKSKMVLEAVDRFIGKVKQDSAVREETERIVDPSARHLFSLWTNLFECWCKGGESPELEQQIETLEAVLQNFCSSSFYMRKLKDALPKGDDEREANEITLQTYENARDEITAALLRLIRGEPARISDARWADRFRSDKLYMKLLWQRHQETQSRSARRYCQPHHGRTTLNVTGQRGRINVRDVLPKVPLKPGQKIYVGFNLMAPSDLFAKRIREQVTSQIEKFDTTLRVTLGEGDTLESGVKVYRGWNELEFPFTAGFSSSSPTLLISSASELETDLELGAIWWRIAD